MVDHNIIACPLCNEVRWTKTPHPKYVLSEFGPNGITTGGIPVDVYLCTNCRFVKLIHS